MSAPLNFVLCPSFHGATLLGLLANNHSRITALGDTLPTRAHMDYYCSCRSTIAACTFWQSLDRRLGAGRFSGERLFLPTVPRIVGPDTLNNRITRHFIRAGTRLGVNPWAITPRAAREFCRATEELAEAACDLQGTRVFLDGAKDTERVISYLTIARPQRVRVIHLVRDPRAFVLSWETNRPAGAEASTFPMRHWNDYHGGRVHRIRSFSAVEYLRVRYEDLCSDPGREMDRVFAFLGVDSEDVVGPPTEPHHAIGNRMLFTFDGTVRLDTRWMDEMPDARRDEVIRHTRRLAEEFCYV